MMRSLPGIFAVYASLANCFYQNHADYQTSTMHFTWGHPRNMRTVMTRFSKRPRPALVDSTNVLAYQALYQRLNPLIGGGYTGHGGHLL